MVLMWLGNWSANTTQVKCQYLSLRPTHLPQDLAILCRSKEKDTFIRISSALPCHALVKRRQVNGFKLRHCRAQRKWGRTSF
jgi:hypothetical protein